MSNATRTDTQSPALHVADSHDLIRVQGARENNLKDVSVEIPKRRLTVFTGVSGSGKSSLVFDTIAASQRMINETYSAFVQGFMPTLARPEVDVLEGADDGDHRRPGADGLRSAPPSAPTPTRCCASSTAGSGSRTSAFAHAYSFNVPTVKASEMPITTSAAPAKAKTVVRASHPGGMSRAARAWARSPSST